MSALRVLVFFENAELDPTILSLDEKHRIIDSCNALWKTAETKDVKYRTLPADDGELYVIPGDFDECRCSDSEVTLGDKLGEFDYDDHHFYRTMLPENIETKCILYVEDDGILRERKMVGDIHPLFEGLYARFEIVHWEST